MYVTSIQVYLLCQSRSQEVTPGSIIPVLNYAANHFSIISFLSDVNESSIFPHFLLTRPQKLRQIRFPEIVNSCHKFLSSSFLLFFLPLIMLQQLRPLVPLWRRGGHQGALRFARFKLKFRQQIPFPLFRLVFVSAATGSPRRRSCLSVCGRPLPSLSGSTLTKITVTRTNGRLLGGSWEGL